MNTQPLITPCVGNADLYDIVLYDENVTGPDRMTATHKAAALCRTCPIVATCDGRITLDSAPQELVLLPDDWMPPKREGVKEPEEPPRRGWSADRRAGAAMTIGRDYVRPDQRVIAWARMAAGLAAQGRSVPQIADALYVTEDTARALLAIPGIEVIAA